MSGAQTAAPTPGAPAAPPPGSQPAQPGQPPIGSSPATGATQNLGFAAKGVQAAAALVSGMYMLIPLVGAQTPIGSALAKAAVDINKHIPPGTVSPQQQQEFFKQMIMKTQQMGPQRAAVASQGAAPPMPPPGGAPPPGA